MACWEYKTIKFEAEGWLVGGKVNDKKLDQALNDLGSQGWRVINIITTNQMQGVTREIVAVLERERRE